MSKFSRPLHFEPEKICILSKAENYLEKLRQEAKGNLVGFEDGRKNTLFKSAMKLETDLLTYIAKLPKSVRPLYDFSVLTITETNGLYTNIFLVGNKQVAIEILREAGEHNFFVFDGEDFSPVSAEEFEQFKNSLEDFIETPVFKEIQESTREKIVQIIQSEIQQLLPEILKKEVTTLFPENSIHLPEGLQASILEGISRIVKIKMEQFGLSKIYEILMSDKPFHSYRFQNKIFYEVAIVGDSVKYLVLDLNDGTISESVQNLKTKLLNEKNPLPRIRSGSYRH